MNNNGNSILMSWPRYVEGTTSISHGHDFLCWGNYIFLVATSLMHKKTYLTIATRDYQRWINYFILNYYIILEIIT